MANSSAASAPAASSGPPHTVVDDLQAGVTAVILASLGLALLNSAGLMTGGTPGLGFLLSYASGMPLGIALFLANLPFYWLGWRAIGPRFTLRTLAAVSALALGVAAVQQVLVVRTQPLYAALAGGVLIGTALLVMFRHRASFGGINILALCLHQRFGWSTGKVQLAVDLCILAGAFFVMDARRVGLSVLGALALNAVLVWNHRPGRYLAESCHARRPAAPGARGD
ncbi:YitT family protein [Caldimonas sp. KR1-144]|uniref:YitT family protein n=1 Tax=Caldimonas sp. KR1-144 TaxID=3400911 RepID=UPI003BFE36DD